MKRITEKFTNHIASHDHSHHQDGFATQEEITKIS